MNVEVLLTEAEIAKEFAESVQARDLPEKFFYWFPLSTGAWLARSSNSTAQKASEPWGLIGSKIADITGHFKDTIPVVSYGAGDGRRDMELLRKLSASGKTIQYFPVDASQTLLEVACSSAEDLDIEVTGIKADISSRMHLLLAADVAEAPRLFLLAGNTLGGFDPLEQIKIVAESMRAGDRLVIDGALFEDDALSTAANEQNRQFAFAPLASIGVREEDGEIRFDQKSDSRREGLYLITKYFHALQDLRVTVSGEDLTLARGERIFLNFRYMFTPQAFEWLLTEHGGLKILGREKNDTEATITAVCSR